MRPRYAARSVFVLIGLTAAALCNAVAQTAQRSAHDCVRLRGLRLAHTTITVAEPVNESFAVPGSRDTVRKLPALCRVAGEIRPTADSHIRFEVWLPLEKWNGNFAGVGNGGWGGTISYAAPPFPAAEPATLADEARRGYAVASTNTGHDGDAFSARFAYGHPERLVDFASRAVHEMTVAAKAVSQAFYGKPPRHAYWIGCSTGGRQGLTEAQRFPADYDGIVAGAPASNWMPIATSSLSHTIAALGDSSRYLPPAALGLIKTAVMKACDRLDGVEDGVIDDPRRCRFDPGALRCGSPASAPGGRCLKDGKIDADKLIYCGVVYPTNGSRIAPGLEPGSEQGWIAWATPGRALALPITDYQWLVFADSTWDWRSFDLANAHDHDVWTAADRRLTPILSAIDPDLRAFRARGGKLLEYHGWSDPLVSPEFSIEYYDSVVSRDSTAGERRADALADVQRFYRLFMVPGMGHCGGGDGPNTFDMERALADWVEHGVAPASVIATHRGPGGVPNRERPICPYPETAVYNRDGDANLAASFACRVPAVPRE
jgi:feruloyl esterase